MNKRPITVNLIGLLSIFSGIIVVYKQLETVLQQITKNDNKIVELAIVNESLKKSNKELTDALALQNHTLMEIKSNISNISNTTPTLIESSPNTVLYVLGIAMFFGIVFYFSMPSNETMQTLSKNGSLQAGEVLHKVQTENVKDIVEVSNDFLATELIKKLGTVERNLSKTISCTTTELENRILNKLDNLDAKFDSLNETLQTSNLLTNREPMLLTTGSGTPETLMSLEDATDIVTDSLTNQTSTLVENTYTSAALSNVLTSAGEYIETVANFTQSF
jgi:hypothetical protein